MFGATVGAMFGATVGAMFGATVGAMFGAAVSKIQAKWPLQWIDPLSPKEGYDKDL